MTTVHIAATIIAFGIGINTTIILHELDKIKAKLDCLKDKLEGKDVMHDDQDLL